jgi:hypothetical protein
MMVFVTIVISSCIFPTTDEWMLFDPEKDPPGNGERLPRKGMNPPVKDMRALYDSIICLEYLVVKLPSSAGEQNGGNNVGMKKKQRSQHG